MSDHNRKGWVSINEGRDWILEWSKVISPRKVCLFGGEPLLNRDLSSWIDCVYEAWPNTIVKIITNGFFLDRVPILDWLKHSSELQVSLHFRNDNRRQQILSNLKKEMSRSKLAFRNKPAADRHEQLRFTANGIDVIVAEFGDFRKPYANEGDNMRPSEGNPALSHSKCGSPNNPILYKNRLYKCGPVGNLRDTLTIYGKDNDEEWSKYLKYNGYGSGDDLTDFVNHINKPEWVCSMCPDNDRELIDHYALGSVVEKREC